MRDGDRVRATERQRKSDRLRESERQREGPAGSEMMPYLPEGDGNETLVMKNTVFHK